MLQASAFKTATEILRAVALMVTRGFANTLMYKNVARKLSLGSAPILLSLVRHALMLTSQLGPRPHKQQLLLLLLQLPPPKQLPLPLKILISSM